MVLGEEGRRNIIDGKTLALHRLRIRRQEVEGEEAPNRFVANISRVSKK